MKKIVFLAVALLACALPKEGQALFENLSEGLYVGGQVGVAIPANSKVRSRHHQEIGVDLLSVSSSSSGRDRARIETGYYVAGVLGWRTCNNLRFEGEIGFRQHDVKRHRREHCEDFFVESDSFDGSGSGSDSHSHKRHHRKNIYTTAYLANVYYDFQTCYCLKPYVGFGVGYATISGHVRPRERHHEVVVGNDDTSGSGSHSKRHHRKNEDGFAWQAIAGVAYEFTECVDLTLDYRYFQPRRQRFADHNVSLGARMYF